MIRAGSKSMSPWVIGAITRNGCGELTGLDVGEGSFRFQEVTSMMLKNWSTSIYV